MATIYDHNYHKLTQLQSIKHDDHHDDGGEKTHGKNDQPHENDCLVR